MSLVSELGRRNVFRVGAAYLIVAWLIVQIIDVVNEPLSLPGWFDTVVILLLAMGFPIALIMAWAYEMTPEGLKSESSFAREQSATPVAGQRLNYIILGLLVLAVAFLIVDEYLLNVPQERAMSTDILSSDSRPVVAGVVLLSDAAHLASGAATIGFDSPLIAVSPDSSSLVYVGRSQSDSALYRRRLDRIGDSELIPGTNGAIYAFFSPDGQHVGFLTDEHIRRVSIQGNDLRTIASTRNPVRARWAEQDWVYFMDNQGFRLRRVRAEGGEVETVLDGTFVWLSDVLPDGRSALATQSQRSISHDHSRIMLVDLVTGDLKSLGVSGYDARWISTEHLVFGRSGNVVAVPFDRQRGNIVGEPVPLVREAAMDSLFNTMQVAVSAEGTLVYIPGSDRAIGRLVAIDRGGVERTLPKIPLQQYGVLDLSKNDEALAIHVADVNDYVWIYDLVRQEGRKLAGSDGYGWPRWNGGGTTLASSTGWIGDRGSRIVLQSTDTAAPARLIQDLPDKWVIVTDWSATDVELAVSSVGPLRIGFVSSAANDSVRWIDDLQGSQYGPVFSPDGQWVAYHSNETGRFEIWIRSYPDGDVRRQLSVKGGIEPVWCDCGEIFFRRGNQFWSTAIQLNPVLTFGPEQHVFTVTDFIDTPGRSYDVSSDGETLFTIKRAEPAVDDRIYVIANWFEEFRRLAQPEE